ncbi:hypothetical protein Ahy_B02g059950 [Arachis hypogaea]|uniref:PB1-like domain-containing protein n=1 Tax=Arachis hypogaea TaxID=3818 RepID=A0A445AHN2_ARAHY|nr:hypothetical protein Ahy_B02g059950 [Arachis hypogaea]
METIHITLVISHRGKFKKGDDGKLADVGGEKTEIERVNADTLNKFYMNDLVKDIGCTDVSELYWLEPGKELDGGLRLLKLDMDVVTVYEAAIANERRVEVFTEHPVNLLEFVEKNNEPKLELEILTVNRIPVKHRTKQCVRRPPTPKKKRKRLVKLSETVGGVPRPDAQTEDDVVHKDFHHTPRNTQQPDLSNDQPNIPTHSPKIPQPCQEPEFQEQSIQNEKKTPVSGSQPSSSQPEPDINVDVGGGSQKKRKRRSTVRPPPSGQTFIPNQDPNKHPSFFIPVDGEDMSEASAGMHCYESEELDSVASDDEDSQQATFPQANPNAPVREVREKHILSKSRFN